jgi:DNA-binding CsgD family transcriptional regulator
MKKIAIIIFVLSFTSVFVGQAQEHKIDSLKQELKDAQNNRAKLQLADKIAASYLKQKKYDSLAKYDLLALDLSIQLNDTVQMMRFHTEVGMDFYGNGDFQNAITHYKNSLQLYKSYSLDTSNRKKIDAYRFSLITNNLGAVYTKLGLYDSAIHYLVISTSEKERLKVDDKKLLVSYYNLSGLCVNKNDIENGLKYTNRAYKLATEIKDTLMIIRASNNLGVLNKRQGKIAEALQYYDQSIKLSKLTDFNAGLSASLTNKGIIYADQEKWDVSKRCFLEAFKLNVGVKNKSDIAFSLNMLANNELKNNNIDSAIYFAKESLELSLETGEIQLPEYSYKILQEAFSENGNFEKAYLYQNKYLALHDSLYNLKSDENYQELQTKYQTSEREKEILELKYETEIQKTQKLRLYWLVVVLMVVSAFIIVLILLKRKKDKVIHAQEQLVLKKEKDLADVELEKSKLQEEELKKEIQYKSKQLTTHALNMMQKNTLMQEIQEELAELSKKAKTENKAAFSRLKMLIKRNLRSEKDWDLFKLYFEDVNKNFYEDLQKLSADLTSNDLKLCALLKLNMNIKESASVLNIEPASVKTARYKLRKKLGLQPEEDLTEFIRKIG